MRKFLVIAIPVVAIVAFILIMISDNWLKNSLGDGENIPDIISGVIEDINDEKWDETENGIRKLESSWDRVINRVQFSVERDEINSFDSNLARLKGTVLARDKAGSLAEIYEALEHWKGMGR